MMQVRCQRCGWMFTMGREAIGIAVAEAQQANAEYYQADCPKCRKEIKIQVKDLRRRLPADYTLPTLLPRPQPVHVKKDEEKPERAEPAAKPARSASTDRAVHVKKEEEKPERAEPAAKPARSVAADRAVPDKKPARATAKATASEVTSAKPRKATAGEAATAKPKTAKKPRTAR